MNRKQRIIVSVTGIFLVLLILVGLTYAYFLTKIKGNDNEKSISVTTANLELVYGDGNALITAEKIEPGNSITAKTFTVTNSGNATINNYAVYLEELVNNLERTSDMVYTLTCTSSVTNSTCNGKTETVFPTQNGILVTNNIVKDEVQTYSLQLSYKEMNVDQSVDMGKEVSAKVQIYNLRDIVDITGTVTGASEGDYVELHSNPKKSQINNNTYTIPGVEPGSHTIYLKDKDGTVLGQKDITINKGETAGVSGTTITTTEDSQTVTINLTKTSNDFTINLDKVEDYIDPTILKNAIILNAKNPKNSNRTTLGTEVTTFTSTSGANEHVLNTAPDDYGTSYYFRGNVIDNYVNFANLTWRIVRINGDGSIRLILDGVAKDTSGNAITTTFNTNKDDNAYVGYMYGTAGSTTYEATHENKNDSTIKIAVDKWYEDNLKTNYASYLSDTLFCGDKTLAKSGVGSDNTAKGYGTNITYYSSTERLMYSSGTTKITTSTPTLKCAEKTNDNYSRYTVNQSTLPNGKETNGNLKYPIGLLTADEVAYAGAYKYNQGNKTYYLYNSSMTSYWWLSSPYFSYGSLVTDVWYVNGSFGSVNCSLGVDLSGSFRPSINLNADLLLNGGDGTKENPYTVKLS